MRLVPLAAVLAATASFAVPAHAGTPAPASCTAVAHGVVAPANPGDLVGSAAVVTYGAEVVCKRDPLTTPPIDHATGFTGDLSIEVFAADGTMLCAGNPLLPGRYSSPSSVLVMANDNVCVVPVSNPHRLQPMTLHAYWATMPPYICCAGIDVPITPAGAGVKP
ncbi:MAG TPA: hypothetical protein VFQ85_15285 [Mycobacteriales bacterium]|jgi:hypothetical protein|nr:hypothetical protein [Mycobacteriales bacterium]